VVFSRQVITELLPEAAPSELKRYRSLRLSSGTVMVSWQEGRALKECELPSPASVEGETEQPESMNVAAVPVCSAKVRVNDCVTGVEKLAVIIPDA
jgi:hypothetical protein